MIVNEWMRNYDVDGHIQKIREIYRKKLNLMCDLIDELLTDYVTYNRPEGGLFIWCKLPDNVSMLDFCKKAVENKVALVPGNAFTMHDTDPTQCFRMNFSTPTDENIVKGMHILAGTAREFIKK